MAFLFRKFKDEIEKIKRLSYPGPDFEVSPLLLPLLKTKSHSRSFLFVSGPNTFPQNKTRKK